MGISPRVQNAGPVGTTSCPGDYQEKVAKLGFGMGKGLRRGRASESAGVGDRKE